MRPDRLTDALVDRYTSAGMWNNALLDDYAKSAAELYPDDLALVDRERTWTFAEVDERVNRVAAALQSLGVGKGDVVSWQLPNWAEACVLHLAVLRVGGISNPIVAIYREREVSFILKQARSKIYVAPASFRNFDYFAMLAKLRPQLPALEALVCVGGDAPDGVVPFERLLEDEAPVQPVERTANDVVLLLFTSGTTADPKGALHTHNTLGYEVRSIRDLFEVSRASGDVIFMPSPLTHVTGLLYGIQMPFMLGIPVVLQDIWDPEQAVELVERYRCTWTMAATPFLHGLVSASPPGKSTIRSFSCGGADVPPELVRRAAAHLDSFVTRIYGSTEYPTATSGRPGDPLEKCALTDGRPIGDALVRIVDEEDRVLPPGVAGELQVSGPELFLGYLDPSHNIAAFTPDGWFRTGDQAVIDLDGFVQITGRKKDIILRGGENISAKEVEDLIFEHPKVAEVAVVAKPDPVLTERVCAFVVPRQGEEITLAELIGFLGTRGIAKQKLPEDLRVVSELPRTASGKIQKFRLRDQLKTPPSAPVGTSSADARTE